MGHYTGAHTVIFRGIFSIYYSPDGTSEAEVGGAVVGGGGHHIFEGAEYLRMVRWVGRGAGNIIFDLGSPMERYTPLAARARA